MSQKFNHPSDSLGDCFWPAIFKFASWALWIPEENQGGVNKIRASKMLQIPQIKNVAEWSDNVSAWDREGLL